MSRDREVKVEKDFWGNEHQNIYENGEKIGEYRVEQRGGFLGFGEETHRVEYNSDGEEIGYSNNEERGGFFGLCTESVEVNYDLDGVETGYSRIEERGGFIGIGAHHERIGYDENGDETSSTHWEKRGGILGFGEERVRVTKYSERKQLSENSSGEFHISGTSNSAGSAVGLIFLAIAVLFLLGGPGDFIRIAFPSTACKAGMISNEECSRPPSGSLARLQYDAARRDSFQQANTEEATEVGYSANPSFKCSGGINWVQKTICNNDVLASQDREVASLSESLLNGQYSNEVREINTRWREEWDRCGGSGSISGCLTWVYREWLEQLRARQENSQPLVDSLTSSDTSDENDLSTLAETAKGWRDQLSEVEDEIKSALPPEDQVDYVLTKDNWKNNAPETDCFSRPECAAPLYRKRIEELLAIRSPHFKRPEGVIVESDSPM